MLTHRIEAAGMKRVAFEHSDQGEPGAFPGAIFPERGQGVLGTGRIKTATGGKKGGYQYLIKTDKENKDLRNKFTGHS